MHVALRNRDGYTVSLPLGVQLKPLRFSRSIWGGYEKAEVDIVGPAAAVAHLQGKLRYGAEIYNQHGTRCWAGFVNETAISTGVLRKAKSLDNLSNRVAVIYSYEDETGGYAQAGTSWAEDADSIATYGEKELIYSAGDQNGTSATKLRDSLLKAYSKVRRTAANDGSAAVKGSLSGLGWWQTLGWNYFANNEGLTSYDASASTEQPIGWVRSATTISFTGPHTIADSGGVLGGLQSGDKFVVSGSASNNATFTVDTAGEDSLTVLESVTNEAAGASVTLTAYGTEVAQSFTADGTWEIALAGVWVKKVGSPTSNLLIELMTGTNPTTILATATIAAGDITQTLRQRVGAFDSRNAQTVGTTYWLRVRKAPGGTYDHANYYVIGLDPDAGYGSGTFKLKSGSTWYDRPSGGDAPFAVLGVVDNATMLKTILASNPFFEDASAVIASLYDYRYAGVERNQYRDGSTLASDEAAKLMAQYTDNGKQLMAFVSPVRAVLITSEPAVGNADYIYRRDRRLYYTNGQRVQPGVLPVGHWVKIEDEMSASGVSVEFMVAAEYDVERDEVTPVWRGAVDPIAQLTGVENR